MKICIVGPGILPIPPVGWGAVEILIHDYRVNLEKLGNEVHIVNTQNRNQIVSEVNAIDPDFVHIQYDDFVNVSPYINCRNIAITSHYGYLEQPDRWDQGYRNIFGGFINSGINIFCLSSGIKSIYLRGGISSDRLSVVPNGVRNDLFRFDSNCRMPGSTIYLAKVDYRKRQHIFQSIPDLYFAGNVVDRRFNVGSKFYLGEWNKEYLYENLTAYASLALLSDGEAHPLVCLEAMSAGLGLVLSECATANLDTTLPFIDVVPEDRIHDTEYVSGILKENREKSVPMREEIREYVVENFSWENIVKNHYLPEVEKIMSRAHEQEKR